MKPRCAGFTMVELLASLAFVGILMPAVISALLISSRAASTAERSSMAAQLCENKLNELMLGDAWASESSRGDFGAERPGYRWELTKNDWTNGDMTELTLAVFYTVQGSEHDVKLSTLVNESLSQPQ